MSIFSVLIIAYAAVANASIFQRNFEKLHREPPPPPPSPILGRAADVETNTIIQKVDHFDDDNKDTWKMRYFSNDVHFKPGGPMFIFVGGEWEITTGYMIGGHLFDLAKEHNGYLFYTEHRYYGKSHPTKNLSYENLRFLSVKQALSDLKYFIETMKEIIPGLENSKVVLAGGSYSATMVTWFQRMFPNVAEGSWASSAPIQAKVDFVEYKEITGESIKQMGGVDCYNRIEKAISELQNMSENGRSAEVKSLLKICNSFDFNNKLDVYTLFSIISDLFADVVQNHSVNTIQNVCAEIMTPNDDVEGLATYILRKTFNPKSLCSDMSYKSFLESFSDTSNLSGMLRPWTYQTCSEFGWYQTSGSNKQPFGNKFPAEVNIMACRDAFSEEFTNETIHKNIEETNKYFGGLNPETENVYFSHGQLDPWRAMGVQRAGEATVIPEHAHCKDFGSIRSSDSPAMRASKEMIAKLVRKWVE